MLFFSCLPHSLTKLLLISYCTYAGNYLENGRAGDRVVVSLKRCRGGHETWSSLTLFFFRAGASPDGVASISLAQGSKAAPPAAEEQVKVVAKLASEVSASEGKYAMKLPTNIAPSNDCKYKQSFSSFLPKCFLTVLLQITLFWTKAEINARLHRSLSSRVRRV